MNSICRHLSNHITRALHAARTRRIYMFVIIYRFIQLYKHYKWVVGWFEDHGNALICLQSLRSALRSIHIQAPIAQIWKLRNGYWTREIWIGIWIWLWLWIWIWIWIGNAFTSSEHNHWGLSGRCKLHLRGILNHCPPERMCRKDEFCQILGFCGVRVGT